VFPIEHNFLPARRHWPRCRVDSRQRTECPMTGHRSASYRPRRRTARSPPSSGRACMNRIESASPAAVRPVVRNPLAGVRIWPSPTVPWRAERGGSERCGKVSRGETDGAWHPAERAQSRDRAAGSSLAASHGRRPTVNGVTSGRPGATTMAGSQAVLIFNGRVN
jgi:hypothetical protein